MTDPRRYRDENDLEAMHNLLIEGRRADNGTCYVHPGDLSWWLFYPPLEGDFWDHIYLWDDPKHPGELLGWALISPDWVGMDVYTQPELKGSQIATDMYGWTENEATRIARERHISTIHMFWVWQDDELLVSHLLGHGFERKRRSVYMSRSLDNLDAPVPLPGGFSLRSCLGEPEVSARAQAQYAAFESSANFDQYVERFTNFMRSPVYNHELDIVAVAPDGRIGAFSLLWVDLVNRTGHFEPVGTHPDFQRMGLGRAVMIEGLRRLQSLGLTSADVVTGEDNIPAIKLYEAVGFQITNRLMTFGKDV